MFYSKMPDVNESYVILLFEQEGVERRILC